MVDQINKRSIPALTIQKVVNKGTLINNIEEQPIVKIRGPKGKVTLRILR